MIFNKHYNIQGTHAFLSASQYAWMNYDEEKLQQSFATSLAAKRGSELHALAHELIRLGIKLPKTNKTLNLYVNDAIGFRMKSEQILFYSENAYGTADTISFRKELLRIHDLKTGITPASFHQLEVYAAFFCLEYRIRPFDIGMEFRIYQNDDVQVSFGDPDDITRIMEKIKLFDKHIVAMKLEADGLS